MSDEAKPVEQAEGSEQKQQFVFGAGSALGTGGGFGAFAAQGAAAAPANKDADGGDDDAPGEEEECQAEFKPVVQLEEVETKTGEEDEEPLFEAKCKLYRYASDTSEWKERGVGPVKLLKNKETGKTRLLMRAEKTGKVRANHLVIPGTDMQPHSGSDKAWVWCTLDYAEGEMRNEMFAVRFGSAEKAKDFKTNFDEAGAANEKLMGASKEAAEDADKLADAVGATTVDDAKDAKDKTD
ncbi:unnamed protein product [Pedinophyceae sp. YPF-701]|nr:unnamed protein product [Pedinophyceae sp. YPF-701]